MPIESATYINQLAEVNPPGSDLKLQGDDQIRLIKSALLNTLPTFNAAILASVDELNTTVNLVKPLQAQINLKAAINSQAFTGIPIAPYPEPGAPGDQMVTVQYARDASLTPAVLPGQAGKTDWIMATDGTSANWTNVIDTNVVKPSGGVDFVTELGTENLRNKVLPGAIMTDGGTKQLTFDVSAVTPGVTRNIYLDNADTALREHREVLLGTYSVSGTYFIDIPLDTSVYSNIMLESTSITPVFSGVAVLGAQLFINGVIYNTAHYTDYDYSREVDRIPLGFTSTGVPTDFDLWLPIAGSNERQVANVEDFTSPQALNGWWIRDTSGPIGKITAVRIALNKVTGTIAGSIRVWGLK